MSDRGALAGRLRRLGPRTHPYDGPKVASLAVLVGVLLLNLLQQPGRITFDTKLDLQFAPAEFLSRSLSLWNPDSAVGGLQNQAYGYLFPMGPAFVLGDQLGVPVWVWERLWSALVMLVAYEGARRLARSWPGVGVWGAVVAGLAYMAAPRVLTTVGALSGETLPGAVLPWTVLPLVLYLRGRWRRAPALVLSAASVLFMGGQNATLVVACLILPGLLLLTAPGRRLGRVAGDVVVWSLLVVAATAWWLVPLVLLGSYAPPFLDFIESSKNTASGTSWLTSLRGTNHWVAFFPEGGTSGWVGGWELATSQVLLVTTVLVATAGLAGLALGGLALRPPLVVSLLTGLTFLTLGSGGWSGSPLAGVWLDALDTWLAPLRNVHKFDPLVRLPLSLGVGAFVTTLLPQLAAALFQQQQQRRRWTGGLGAITAVLVLAAAQPALAGHLRSADGMEELPDEWRAAAAYLDALPGPVGVLVLPGSGFAVQEWGRTVDEPIQVVGAPPWVARAQVTVAPAGTLRVLDALERRIADGRPVPGIAAVLRRLGITHVLVRDDLDPASTDAPSAGVVRASLSGSLELSPAAEFGDGDPSRLEIYAVESPSDRRVALQTWDDRAVVDGASDSVVDLVGAGVLGPDDPMVVLGDDAGATAGDSPDSADVVTDSNRRVERSFGRVHDAVSGVLTSTEEFRVERSVHDYVGDEVPSEQTVAEYDGIAGIVASSSAGYADTFGRVRPEEHPYSAVDPSLLTSWGSDPFVDPEGQWLELRLPEPVELGDVTLQFDVTNGADVVSVALVTDAGRRTLEVGLDGRVSRSEPPPGMTDRLRVVVQQALGGRRQVRLSDVSVGGLDMDRTLRLPGSLSQSDVLHVGADVPRRACAGIELAITCSAGRQVETSEAATFARTFEVSESGTWEVHGTVLPTHGPSLTGLFDPLGEDQVSVEASSSFGGDPAVTGAFAHDGRRETSWYAAPVDEAPVLDLRWKTPRTITSVVAILEATAPGRLPDALVVDAVSTGREPQLVAVTGPDAGKMDKVRTTRLRVTALVDEAEQDGEGEAVGISELEVAGIEDLVHRPRPSSETGVLCGFGPTVSIAGRDLRLGIRGTLGDVTVGAPLELTACDLEPLELSQGEHRLEVDNIPGFSVSSLVLRPAEAENDISVAGSAGTVSVTEWNASRRLIDVDVADESAVLSVPESFNSGWHASLGGETLAAVRVDGWKQGWVLPADATGPVRLVYRPQEMYALGLGFGTGMAALLVLAAGLLWRRRTRSGLVGVAPSPARDTSRGGRLPRGVVPAAFLALAVVSVWLAVGAAAGAVSGRLRLPVERRLLWAAATLLPTAGLLVLIVGDSPLTPPEPADALTAMAVGVAVGLAMRRGDRSQPQAEGAR